MPHAGPVHRNTPGWGGGETARTDSEGTIRTHHRYLVVTEDPAGSALRSFPHLWPSAAQPDHSYNTVPS